MPLCIHKLTLSRFRNHDAARLSPGGARLVVLTGENGAGKTNVLEAVSLLAPGKGLRGADLADMQAQGGGDPAPFAVAAEVETPQGRTARIGTGLDRERKRRVVRIDGRDAKTQGELAEVFSAVWLTPQMDRLFLDGPSQRRRFLDRLVYAFDPAHAARVSRHDKALRERMKLLQGDRAPDPRWLDGVEAQAAAEGVAIAAARMDFISRMQGYAAQLGREQALFPAPRLSVEGTVEQRVASAPALEVEDGLRAMLRAARGADAAAGRTQDGVHRSNLAVVYAAKDMPAARCSTGEQKGLLISVILAHALMMKSEMGFVPLVLLDEIAAHLDEARRAQLFGLLSDLGAQVWMTGTDEALFGAIGDKALFFRVENGRVHAQRRLEAAS